MTFCTEPAVCKYEKLEPDFLLALKMLSAATDWRCFLVSLALDSLVANGNHETTHQSINQ